MFKNRLKCSFLALFLLLGAPGCNITKNLSDGYDFGDVSAGAVNNYRDYCRPRYTLIRMAGRWILRLISYPVPNLCPKTP